MERKRCRNGLLGGVVPAICGQTSAKAGESAGGKRKPARKRVKAAVGGEGAKGAKSAKPKPKAVADGQHFIKQRLLKELSGITDKMIKSAKAGGTAPLRLLWELGKLNEDATSKRQKKPPSLGRLLMDELKRQQEQAKQKSDPDAS